MKMSGSKKKKKIKIIVSLGEKEIAFEFVCVCACAVGGKAYAHVQISQFQSGWYGNSVEWYLYFNRLMRLDVIGNKGQEISVKN